MKKTHILFVTLLAITSIFIFGCGNGNKLGSTEPNMEELKKEVKKHTKKLPRKVILARAEHSIPADYEKAWMLSRELTVDIMEYRRINRNRPSYRNRPSHLRFGDFSEEFKSELRKFGLSAEEIDIFEKKAKEADHYYLSKISPTPLERLHDALNNMGEQSFATLYHDINFIYEIFEVVDKGMYWQDIRLAYYTTGMYMHPAARAYFKKEGVFDIITAPF